MGKLKPSLSPQCFLASHSSSFPLQVCKIRSFSLQRSTSWLSRSQKIAFSVLSVDFTIFFLTYFLFYVFVRSDDLVHCGSRRSPCVFSLISLSVFISFHFINTFPFLCLFRHVRPLLLFLFKNILSSSSALVKHIGAAHTAAYIYILHIK